MNRDLKSNFQTFSRARPFGHVMRSLIRQKSFHSFSEFVARFGQRQSRPRIPQVVPRRQILQAFGQSTVVVQNIGSWRLPFSHSRILIQFSVSVRVARFRQTIHHSSKGYSSAEGGPERLEKGGDEHVHG